MRWQRQAALLTTIAGLLLLTGCASDSPTVEAPEPPPDVVLIVVDTLRADHLGIYGYDRDTSPQIDAWSREGAIFDLALATSPWTLPTFGSIFTGQLPTTHSAGLRGSGRRWKRSGLDEAVPTLAEELQRRGYETTAIVNNPFLKPEFGISRGFDSYDYARGRPAGRVVELALEQLLQQRDRPIFLFLHFIDPHLPYRPPAWARGRFSAGGDTRLPRLREIRRRPELLSQETRDQLRDRYDEEIAYLDHSLRPLFEVLAPRPDGREPLVVLTSDHGEELFDHDGFEHGHTMFQELLHVPLVIRGPAVEAGRRPGPVSVADLMPTLLDATSIDSPIADGAPGETWGVSLWPHLSRGERAPDRALVAQTTLYGAPLLALLEWPLKIVVQPDSGQRRLYDLAVDPDERADLADRSPAETRRLFELLRPWAGGSTVAGEVEIDEETLDELEALGYLD